MKSVKDIEKELQRLSRENRQFSLREKDKHMLRSNLEEYMALNPYKGGANKEGVKYAYFGSTRSNVLALFRGTVVGVVGAVLVGGGAAFAAQDALPGQMLYPVKVNFNEEVLSLAAVTTEAEARLQAELAERRIHEVGVLAAKGELSETEKRTLKARFEKHSKASARLLSQLEGKNRSKTVARIQSEFEATLAVHEELLRRLAEGESDTAKGYQEILEDIPDNSNKENKGQDKSTSTAVGEDAAASTTGTSTATTTASSSRIETTVSTGTPAATSSTSSKKALFAVQAKKVNGGAATQGASAGFGELADWIGEQRNEVSAELEKTELQMWSEIKAKVKGLTKDTRILAEGEIKDAVQILAANSKSLSETTEDDAEGMIAVAKAKVASGQAKIKAGEYKEAFEAYRGAMQMALRAQIFVKTGKTLDPYLHVEDFEKDKLNVTLDEEAVADEGTSTNTLDESEKSSSTNTKTSSTSASSTQINSEASATQTSVSDKEAKEDASTSSRSESKKGSGEASV